MFDTQFEFDALTDGRIDDEPEMSQETQESKLQRALYLIKFNIEADDTTKNRQLHEAVQLIVDVARQHGLLQR